MMSHRHRQRRLSYASGTNDRNETFGNQTGRHAANILITSDYAAYPGRQVCVLEIGGNRCGRGPAVMRPGYAGHEAIALASQCRDVPRATLAVTQRLAKYGDVKTQTAFFDMYVEPHAGQQIPFTDDLIRLRHQGKQNIERSR